MATEKRLIDANAICSECLARYSYNCTLCEIGKAPTVDAVEVVRCYKCKHSRTYKCKVDPIYNRLMCYKDDVTVRFVEDDFYCAYGERRTDNERKAD